MILIASLQVHGEKCDSITKNRARQLLMLEQKKNTVSESLKHSQQLNDDRFLIFNTILYLFPWKHENNLLFPGKFEVLTKNRQILRKRNRN